MRAATLSARTRQWIVLYQVLSALAAWNVYQSRSSIVFVVVVTHLSKTCVAFVPVSPTSQTSYAPAPATGVQRRRPSGEGSGVGTFGQRTLKPKLALHGVASSAV